MGYEYRAQKSLHTTKLLSTNILASYPNRGIKKVQNQIDSLNMFIDTLSLYKQTYIVGYKLHLISEVPSTNVSDHTIWQDLKAEKWITVHPVGGGSMSYNRWHGNTDPAIYLIDLTNPKRPVNQMNLTETKHR